MENIEIIIHNINNITIAEIVADDIIINTIEDSLDILGDIYYQGFDYMILHQKNITAKFFELSNKMAGEVLQKFSTYGMKLFIVGEFEQFESKSLRSFIYESNQGRQINFLCSVIDCLHKLGKTAL